MEIQFKVSTQALKIVPPKIKGPTFEKSFMSFVCRGWHFLDEGGNYFKNCVFQVSDLNKIVNQKYKGSDCKYIVFSHVSDKDINGKGYSTGVAFGATGNTPLYKTGEMYISTDVNKCLDFSELKDFDQANDLQWLSDSGAYEVDKEWKPTAYKEFDKWIDQFKPKDSVLKVKCEENNLIKGVYYDIETLKSFGLLDSSKQTQIALFPVTTKTCLVTNPAPPLPELYLITYVLVPVDNCNKLYYAENNVAKTKKLLVSDLSWPHKWGK